MIHQKQKTPIPRILDIVRRLYALEKLKTTNLASEYSKNRRTIHRDLLLIGQFIPLKNINGIWSLVRSSSFPLEHFQQTILYAFAQKMDINTECLHFSNISEDLVSFAIEYKKLPKKLGEALTRCIIDNVQCRFDYTKPDGTRDRKVDPIKLYTENSRWYVIARDYKDDKVKYFNLEKIKNLKRIEEPRTLTPEMATEADAMKSIWSSTGEDKHTVRLYVRPEIAHYIRDIPLHKSQFIHDEHHDGGLEVHCAITHKLELLPQIKYWLPRIHILEPKWLWNDLMRDLEIYHYEDQQVQYE